MKPVSRDCHSKKKPEDHNIFTGILPIQLRRSTTIKDWASAMISEKNYQITGIPMSRLVVCVGRRTAPYKWRANDTTLIVMRPTQTRVGETMTRIKDLDSLPEIRSLDEDVSGTIFVSKVFKID
jgi:hypothetical protein